MKDFSNLVLVHDTGWNPPGHWLCQRMRGLVLEPDDLRRDVITCARALVDDDQWAVDPAWGSVMSRTEEDGEVFIIVRVSSSEQEQAVVLGSSEAYWAKVILELR